MTIEHRPISNELEITAYIHCGMCLEEMPSGISAKDWSRTQAGFTAQGLQVWCNRHDVNVMHIDFDGMKFHANQTRKVKNDNLE